MQRFQKIFDIVDFTYEEAFTTPEGEEILQLAGRSDVRKWIHGRINDFLIGNDERTKAKKKVSVHRRDRHLLELWNFAPQP